VHREIARAIIPNVLEVFVDAPLAVCEKRDPVNRIDQEPDLPDEAMLELTAQHIEFGSELEFVRSTYEAAKTPDNQRPSIEQRIDQADRLNAQYSAIKSDPNPVPSARTP
jgi:hypothetical protein